MYLLDQGVGLHCILNDLFKTVLTEKRQCFYSNGTHALCHLHFCSRCNRADLWGKPEYHALLLKPGKCLCGNTCRIVLALNPTKGDEPFAITTVSGPDGQPSWPIKCNGLMERPRFRWSDGRSSSRTLSSPLGVNGDPLEVDLMAVPVQLLAVVEHSPRLKSRVVTRSTTLRRCPLATTNIELYVYLLPGLVSIKTEVLS